ncbi:MAG: SO_0444 family Cu/Zn efflux transporter [Alphaproteobacteria bacterium]
MQVLIDNLIGVMLEALPFLAFGFFISGILKAFVPNDFIAKHLGKETWYSPIKSALLGAPIPLCSCSVIPVATGLRRGGAGKGSLSSFLISAPETGVDSLSISYAMLGPVIMISRLVSALATAIITAWAIMIGTRGEKMPEMPEVKTCCKMAAAKAEAEKNQSAWQKFITGQRYSFTTLLDDSFKYVMVALVLTAVIKTYVPSGIFTEYGDGFLAMLIMVAVGFPMYICASASTPVAVSLLMIGVSPGAALTFMLAGPASNLATVGVVSKMMGKKASVIYVVFICALSIIAGMTLNELVDIYNWNITFNQGEESLIPSPLAIGSTVFVLLSTIRPLRPYIGLTDKK